MKNIKYVAAISDMDILINLAKVGQLSILENLFKEIIIPYFVYNVELRRKAKALFYHIKKYIKESDIFRIVNREEGSSINVAAKSVINDKKLVIGPGESECAGYATALGIFIIISDNSTERRRIYFAHT